jgi:acyl dehydratase
VERPVTKEPTMTTTTELDSAPSLVRLYAQAPLAGLRGGQDLPDEQLVLRDVEIDRGHLADYDRVCGLRFGEVLPATYLHVLAFPMSIKLLAAPGFPFALPGLVHVANRIDHRRPVTAGERPTFTVRTQDLRAHPKGRQFDVVAEVEVDDEVVWTGVSTYLHRESGGSGGGESSSGGSSGGSSSGEADADRDPGEANARWRVPADTGRRYAAVSGDRNPIHLTAATAKPFGFPKAIAHGMWTAARALAGLEGRLPDAFSYGVRFQTPLLLPSTVTFAARRDGDGDWVLGVDAAKNAKPHLRGVIAAD